MVKIKEPSKGKSAQDFRVVSALSRGNSRSGVRKIKLSGEKKKMDKDMGLPQSKIKSRPSREQHTQAEKLFRTLEKVREKSLLICLRGYPDPDNIASSLALALLAESYNIRAKIVYFDDISHYENRALVKKLDLDLEQVGSDFDASSFDFYAINDSQQTDLPIRLPEACELLVFVDHHKALGTVQGHFVDIRESAGSTSGIYAEYLSKFGNRFTASPKQVSKVATALVHGIRTDTDDYFNASPLDFKASEFLAPFVDRDLLSLISRQAISAKTMDLTQIALQNKDIKGTYLFSGVGFVRDEDRDGIGQCADYLLHREGIETVIVYGVVANSFIDGSLRTKSHIIDPDQWLKTVFGKSQEGFWYGGGRKDKGGFQIPLGVFSKCQDKEHLWIMIHKTIDELFYDKIGVETPSMKESEITTKA